MNDFFNTDQWNPGTLESNSHSNMHFFQFSKILAKLTQDGETQELILAQKCTPKETIATLNSFYQD